MDTARYPTIRWRVTSKLDALVKEGINVIRTWGFSLGKGETPELRALRLHLAPGVYDEAVFRGMDFALHEAARRGIKLIVSLEDYWLSIDRYVEWSPSAGARTDFYTDWFCRNAYRAHVSTFLNRVNTFNGVRYRDDPTIFGWNLMNEPRCTGCGWALQAWIDEMSLFVKTIDPLHMLTIGEEGFYSSSCSRVHLNPGSGNRRTGIASSPWALMEGQDFLANHAGEHVDFATTHVWPDNWLGHADYSPWMSNKAFDYAIHGSSVWKEKLNYTERWLRAHVQDADKLGKPLVVEEFGKSTPSSRITVGRGLQPGERVHGGPGDFYVRDEFFESVYRIVEKSKRDGGSGQGTNFWVLYDGNGEGQDQDPYRVSLYDWTTWEKIREHVRRFDSFSFFFASRSRFFGYVYNIHDGRLSLGSASRVLLLSHWSPYDRVGVVNAVP
jgi:mannan endo-1,4-beta-mannosidase